MAQTSKNSYVSSIKYTHKFQVDIGGRFSKGQGESVYGEKFSPVSGSIFQLRILNLDNIRFGVFLKNCGKEEAKILKFKVKGTRKNEIGSAEKSDFCLQPESFSTLLEFTFQDFSSYGPLSGPYVRSRHRTLLKDFICHLELPTRQGNVSTI